MNLEINDLNYSNINNINEINNKNLDNDYIPKTILSKMTQSSPIRVPYIPLRLLSPRKVLDSRAIPIYLNNQIPRRPDNAWNSEKASKRFNHLRSLHPLNDNITSNKSIELSQKSLSARDSIDSNPYLSEFQPPSLQYYINILLDLLVEIKLFIYKK